MKKCNFFIILSVTIDTNNNRYSVSIFCNFVNKLVSIKVNMNREVPRWRNSGSFNFNVFKLSILLISIF